MLWCGRPIPERLDHVYRTVFGREIKGRDAEAKRLQTTSGFQRMDQTTSGFQGMD